MSFLLTSLIFFPEKIFLETPRDFGFEYEDASIQTGGSGRLHGWFLKSSGGRGVMLFLHGNAGNISHRLYKAKGWVDRGFSVLLADYRGYGQSEGRIEEGEDLVRDSRAALEWLKKKGPYEASRIVVYGESIGSHPALRLGSEEALAAVILEAPFTSLAEIAKIHYPFVPSGLLKGFEFANEESARKLKAPLFILHGTRDEICPYAMGEKLFNLAPGPKELFRIEGGTHNDLPSAAGTDYWHRPASFLEKRGTGSKWTGLK